MTSLAQKIFDLETLLFSDDSPQVMAPERQSFSMKDLVETFPQAKATIKQMIKEDEMVLEEHRELKDKLGNYFFSSVSMSDVDVYTSLALTVIRKDYIESRSRSKALKNIEWIADRLDRNKKLLSLYSIGKGDGTYEQNLAKAKLYPMTALVRLSGCIAKCPLHKERTASFKYYPKNNSWYCFGGCGGGDVINLYMRLNNCTFKEAITKMA